MVTDRREFTRKSIIAILALGTAGSAGFVFSDNKKLRTLLNYYRMGHCAPSVMQTLLDLNDTDNPDLVRSAGAMAGGVAGPNMECGVFTAPVMYLAYQRGIPENTEEKLMIIRQVQAYFREFNRRNSSSICSDIRDGEKDGCLKAVSGFNTAFSAGIKNPATLTDQAKEAYSLLLREFNLNNFHCSHYVFDILKNYGDVSHDLYSASWPFLGGIALLNRTCGALAAGVMALSSKLSGIENNFLKVARMNRMFKNEDPEAMKDDNNDFNKAINSASELGTWFRREFGSTTCYNICGFNFSHAEDVKNYLSSGCLGKCSSICSKVAEKVISMT